MPSNNSKGRKAERRAEAEARRVVFAARTIPEHLEVMKARGITQGAEYDAYVEAAREGRK